MLSVGPGIQERGLAPLPGRCQRTEAPLEGEGGVGREGQGPSQADSNPPGRGEASNNMASTVSGRKLESQGRFPPVLCSSCLPASLLLRNVY